MKYPKHFFSILLAITFAVPLTACEWFRSEPPPEVVVITQPEPEVIPEKPFVPEEKADVIVSSPLAGAIVSAPLVIRGEAKGGWYFEASFPVRLLDNSGNELAVTHAQALEDWMQPGYVPFEAIINSFNPGSATEGKLVLQKDNPSGLPEYDKQIEMPVRFLPGETSTVKVFFGNTVKNPNATDCAEAFAVERVIPKTPTVAMATVTELLKGPTVSETGAGYFTTLNTGVKIQRLVITNGVAEIDFDEQLEFQVGGSCKVMAIRAQIEQTLLQFPTVKEVVISINGRTGDILQP